MIAKLRGMVDDIAADTVILDVSGVGYLVHASSRTLSQLPPRGEEVSLHIEMVVREDAMTLFGFKGTIERDMFRLLTSVQGVGAKVGLAILSVLEPSALQNAIAAQDKKAVSQANGVGPKLAGRIVNELKDKVAGLVLSAPSVTKTGAASDAASATASEAEISTDGNAQLVEEAVSALSNLGYRPVDAHGIVAKLVMNNPDVTLSSLIPMALKELSSVS